MYALPLSVCIARKMTSFLLICMHSSKPRGIVSASRGQGDCCRDSRRWMDEDSVRKRRRLYPRILCPDRAVNAPEWNSCRVCIRNCMIYRHCSWALWIYQGRYVFTGLMWFDLEYCCIPRILGNLRFMAMNVITIMPFNSSVLHIKVHEARLYMHTE